MQISHVISSPVGAEQYRKLKSVVEALTYLTDLVADQQTTIHDLRELLFPATKKTEAALKKVGMEGRSKAAADPPGTSQAGKRKQNAGGHGRKGRTKLQLGQSDQIHAPALASAHFVLREPGALLDNNLALFLPPPRGLWVGSS